MLFNSIEFALFLPIVFVLYWIFRKNTQTQNLFLLAASYFFYAWWDWRYLSLILFCSITNYLGGLFLIKTEVNKHRKLILTICCCVSLGVLCVFKYYDFFVNAFVDAFTLFGYKIQSHSLNLILPVGISFYTFHTLSYTIDVYRRNFEPTKNIISFFLFVSIFPLAMAGPIERATNLLPQIYKKRKFNDHQAVDGLRQILWGLFKKVVIADNCAKYADLIFNNSTDFMGGGGTLFIGALFFTFQIYCDFSGYSDMALGIGKLLGFKFLRNFNFPYFSRDIAEFWRRWHISLTTWFRDYLYIPLGGSRGSKWMVIRNTFIIFLVSGFWHGANWTFIAWGGYHAVLFLPLILLGKNRKYTNSVAEGKLLPNLKELFQISITFFLVLLGWIMFRAENIHHFWSYITEMLSPSLFTIIPFKEMKEAGVIVLFIGFFMFIEWLGRNDQFAIEKLGLNKKRFVRWLFYILLTLIIIFFSLSHQEQQFIYFQF